MPYKKKNKSKLAGSSFSPSFLIVTNAMAAQNYPRAIDGLNQWLNFTAPMANERKKRVDQIDEILEITDQIILSASYAQRQAARSIGITLQYARVMVYINILKRSYSFAIHWFLDMALNAMQAYQAAVVTDRQNEKKQEAESYVKILITSAVGTVASEILKTQQAILDELMDELSVSIIPEAKLIAQQEEVSELVTETVAAAVNNIESIKIAKQEMPVSIREWLRSITDVAMNSSDKRAEKMQTVLNRANKTLAAQNYVVAIEAYKQWIAYKPKDAAAHFNLAQSYKNLGDKNAEFNAGTRLSLPGAKQLAEFVVVVGATKGFNDQDTLRFYNLSQKHFEIGFQLLEGQTVAAEHYLAFAHLLDRQGDFPQGMEYHKKACEGGKGDFYEYYTKLMIHDYDKKMPTVIFRYACIFWDKVFIAYLEENFNIIFEQYFKKKILPEFTSDTIFRLCIDCAFYYKGLVQNDSAAHLNQSGRLLQKYIANAAIQYFLLAYHYGKNEGKGERIFGDYLEKFQGSVDVAVFKDIFGFLSEEHLSFIEPAYREWVNYDLKHGNKAAVTEKVQLLAEYKAECKAAQVNGGIYHSGQSSPTLYAGNPSGENAGCKSVDLGL